MYVTHVKSECTCPYRYMYIIMCHEYIYPCPFFVFRSVVVCGHEVPTASEGNGPYRNERLNDVSVLMSAPCHAVSGTWEVQEVSSEKSCPWLLSQRSTSLVVPMAHDLFVILPATPFPLFEQFLLSIIRCVVYCGYSFISYIVHCGRRSPPSPGVESTKCYFCCFSHFLKAAWSCSGCCFTSSWARVSLSSHPAFLVYPACFVADKNLFETHHRYPLMKALAFVSYIKHC